MASEIPPTRTWFSVLGWIVVIGSIIGNLVILVYIGWAHTLTGAAYAQADLGLFMLLIGIGVPILLLSVGVFVLGCALRPPSINLSARGLRHPLVILLAANIGLVGVSWVYLLFLMP